MIEKPKRPKKPDIQERQPPRTLQELINRYDLDNTKIYNFLDGLVELINTDISNLENQKVNKVINITSTGTNLNDYKEDGEFYFGVDYTPTNIPAGVNGWLKVITGNQQGYNIVKQIWYRHGTPNSNDYETYVRTFSSNTWSSWKMFGMQSTGWTNATLTSKLKSTGAIKYTKIGNVVIVNFVDIEVNSSIASHGDILATGLPNSTIYLISALFNYAEPSKPMRIAITTDGKIQTHYSNNFTASESTGFYGTIVYMTNQ